MGPASCQCVKGRSRGTLGRTWIAEMVRKAEDCYVIRHLMLVLGAMGTSSVAAQPAAGDVLARSIALYPTLESYADTGTVVKEAPGLVDRWEFKTHYRRTSLDFYFDFQGVDSRSGELTIGTSDQRMVLWMIGGELQAFNQQLQTHDTFPREGGNQPAALQGAGAVTAGTSILIPSLVFPEANLPGTIRTIQDATDAGFETVNGRRCHKIIGTAAEYYPSGQMTNVRPVTVWIDAETFLVRKVFEDTPKDYPGGSYSRLTVTIEPQANPTLDDSEFHFTVPAPNQ